MKKKKKKSEIFTILNENMSYDDFLQLLKNAFSEFIILSEKGKISRFYALKARKCSIDLREMFKFFRKISLKQEKKVNEIRKKYKEKINDEILGGE